MNPSSEIPSLRTWVIPAVSCAVSITISLTGAAILIGSIGLALLSRNMNVAAAGVLGGSLLAACGGLALLGSIVRTRRA